MGNPYTATEMLRRLLALEKMQKLSGLVVEASMNFDPASMRMYDAERKEIRDQYFKVVK